MAVRKATTIRQRNLVTGAACDRCDRLFLNFSSLGATETVFASPATMRAGPPRRDAASRLEVSGTMAERGSTIVPPGWEPDGARPYPNPAALGLRRPDLRAPWNFVVDATAVSLVFPHRREVLRSRFCTVSMFVLTL